MLAKVQNNFRAFLLVSALLSATVPIAPTKSQILESYQQLQAFNTQPEKMSPANLLVENVKPSVVRVALGCKVKVYLSKNGKIYDLERMIGHGSGFFVNPNGYIVTNAHVTDLSVEDCKRFLWGELASKLAVDGEDLDNLEQLKWLEAKPINLVYLPKVKQFPFEIINSGAPVGEGKDVSIIRINVRNAPTLKLADSDQVKLRDEVMAIGYPELVEIPDLFDEKSFTEATFTGGQVSAKKILKDGIPVIQIDASTAPGSSGGPVVNEQGEAIGIVTFGPRHSNNFTFIFTSNTVQEFLTSAGITNEQGLVNQKYSEGLQLYSQGKYTQALLRFQSVKSLFPHHSEVENFLQRCQQLIASDRT